MKMLYFIISNLIIIVPIIFLFRYKGDKFLGLQLNKNWFFGLIIVEFIWIVICWVTYQSSINSSIANDFLWDNLFICYRGVLPMTGLLSIKDFSINANSTLILIPLYIITIVIDYIILKFFSVIKNSYGNSK